MVSAQDVLIRFGATDDVSKTANGIQKNITGMGKSASGAIDNLSSSMSMLDSAMLGTLGSVTGKSISDEIFGTSSTAEVNKVLLKNMSETADGATEMYQKVDDVTNSSLISMQQLIPVMKAFKSATGATDDEMMNVTEGIANFGSSVYATTGSAELAQTAMEKLSYGIKGSYAALDQYGITEDSLKATGLWKGDENDVQGYIAAVTEVTGDTKELMQTNQGLDALLSKAFSRAGKNIGNDLLPGLKQLKQAFLGLNDASGGKVAESILLAGGAFSTITEGLGAVGMAANGIKALRDTYTSLKTAVTGAKTAVEGFQAAQETADAIGGASEVGGAVTGAAVNKNTAKNMAKITGEGTEVTTEVGEGATKLGTAGATAGAEAAGAAGGLSALSAGITSMLIPLLTVSAVVAIMIPIIAGLVAEALVFVRGLAMVVTALDFKSVNLSGQINGLKQIGSALVELAVAMAAMTFVSSISIITAVLGSISIGLGTIASAADDIKQTIPVINQLGNMPNINPEALTKLKKVAEALSALSTAMSSFAGTSVNIAVGNIANVLTGGYLNALVNAKDDLIAAVPQINQFSSMPDVDENAAKKLKKVAEALKAVNEAVSALSDLSWDTTGLGGLLNGGLSGWIYALNQSRTALGKASVTLASFNNISNIPEGVGGKIQRVSWTANNVLTAIKSMNKLPSVGVNFTNLTGMFTKARQTIGAVSVSLASFHNISNIGTDVGTKIQRVAWTATDVRNAITRLNAIPATTTNNKNITNAVNSVKKAASELSTLSKTKSVNVGGVVTSVNKAVKQISTTLSSTTGRVKASSTGIGKAISTGVKTGMGNMSSVIVPPFNTAMNSLKAAATTQGRAVGTNVKNGYSSTIKGITQVTQSEINNALSALSAAKSQFYSKGAELGQAASDGYKTTGLQQASPGLIARTTSLEMDYTYAALDYGKHRLYTAAKDVAQAVVKGFGNPNLAVKTNLQNTLAGANFGLGSYKNTADLASMRQIGSSYTPHNNSTVHHTTLNIHEGAVQLDARSLNTKESKQVMINALEGLENVEGVITKKASSTLTTKNSTSDPSGTNKTTSNISSDNSVVSNIFTQNKTPTGGV